MNIYIHNAKMLIFKAYGISFLLVLVVLPSAKMDRNSLYFLSQNAANYDRATSDCKAILGEEATLVCIETQEELANVTEFIRGSDDTGSSYWIGGRFDTTEKRFVWESGIEFGEWVPWDDGQPSTRRSETRVFACISGGVIKFCTQFNIVSTRYICELKLGD